VRIGIFSLIITQLMNLVFIGPFQHAGLALSIGLASCVNAGLLYHGLRKRQVYQPQPGWGRFAGKLLVALVVLGFSVHFTAGNDSLWLSASGIERVIRLCALVLGGIGVYFAVLFALGFRVRDFRRRSA
jgi:putative peptidoglycan lipid II flippase